MRNHLVVDPTTRANSKIMFEEAQDLRLPVPTLARVKKEGPEDVGPTVEPCVVCGDASTGIHYRVQSCEGCKGFWRRTIQRNMGEKYNCKIWTEQCVVNKETRGRCQRCRYLACLRAGMVADLVMADKERNSRLRLVAQNRERRKRENGNISKTEKEEEAEKQDKRLLDLVVAVHGNTLGCAKPAEGEGMMQCVLRGAYKFVESLFFQLMGARDLRIMLQDAQHEVALVHLLATCPPEQAADQPHLALLATSLSLLTPREHQFVSVLAGMRMRTTWPQHSHAELQHLYELVGNIVARACGQRMAEVNEVLHQAVNLTYKSKPHILLAQLEGVVNKATAAPIQTALTNLDNTNSRRFSITPKTPPRPSPPPPPAGQHVQVVPTMPLIKDPGKTSDEGESHNSKVVNPQEGCSNPWSLSPSQFNPFSFTAPNQTPRSDKSDQLEATTHSMHLPQMPSFQSPPAQAHHPSFLQPFHFGMYGTPSPFSHLSHPSPQNSGLSPHYPHAIHPPLNPYAPNFADSQLHQPPLPSHPPAPFPQFYPGHPSYPPPQYLPQYPDVQNPPVTLPDIKGQFPLLPASQIRQSDLGNSQECNDPSPSLAATPFTIKTEFDPDAGVDLTITEFQPAVPHTSDNIESLAPKYELSRRNCNFENNQGKNLQESPPLSPPSQAQDLSPDLPLKKRKLVLEYPRYHSM